MKSDGLLAALLPPGSYEPNAPRLNAQLQAEGRALDVARAAAGGVADAITPYLAGDRIVDWERVLGLTPIGGYQQRLDAVLAKLAETGGLSIRYFTELAARMGYSITIDELQPFWVDYSRVDEDRLYNEDVIWVWRVNISGGDGVRVYPFFVDASCVGDRLLSFGDPVIEAVFEDLKPAHTFVYFAYLTPGGASGEELLTEDGERLITEDGETLLTE